jgi:hypothetical protein
MIPNVGMHLEINTDMMFGDVAILIWFIVNYVVVRA